MNKPINKRLEEYTIKHPQEVLLVTTETDGEYDCATRSAKGDRIAIFKGFSSSLMQATAFDPEIPIISESAKIISIDRLSSPYNPEHPNYVRQGLTLEEMEALLLQVGI
jgi:hypothetical protein